MLTQETLVEIHVLKQQGKGGGRLHWNCALAEPKPENLFATTANES